MENEYASLTDEQRAELAALAELPEDQIDTADISEVLDWTHARRADLYRPIKQQITLRLDADILAWFKERAPGGRGYQTDITRALREHMARVSMWETISTSWKVVGAVECVHEQGDAKWVFRGTSVPVSTLSLELKRGATLERYLAEHPGVDRQKAEAMLEYPADLMGMLFASGRPETWPAAALNNS